MDNFWGVGENSSYLAGSDVHARLLASRDSLGICLETVGRLEVGRRRRQGHLMTR